MENEIVFISYAEFANTMQDKELLKNFRGKKIVNKFEIISREVVALKYDVSLDFENCSKEERKQLRNDYDRLEKKIQQNRNNSRKWSFGLDEDKPFISSEMYPTLIVSTPVPTR